MVNTTNVKFSDDSHETNSSSSEDKGAEEIIYAEIVEGDYNDVYSRNNVKGTWEQIEAYVKSYFSEEGLNRAEEINSDGYGLQIWQEPPDELTDWSKDGYPTVKEGSHRYMELLERYEFNIEYYVEALPYNRNDRDKGLIDELEENKKFIDLGEQD